MIEVLDTTVGLPPGCVLIRCKTAAAGGLACCLELAIGMGHPGAVADLGDRRSACAGVRSLRDA